jgi:hypothetical protein
MAVKSAVKEEMRLDSRESSVIDWRSRAMRRCRFVIEPHGAIGQAGEPVT